jgi:hypothetical protein
MTRFGSCLLFVVLPLIALGIVGCANSRQLQSVTLSPASADAQNFPNGQVSFTATGAFSKAPSPVQLTSKDVMWCAGSSGGMCVGNINPGVTVDQNGLAQCLPGFTGTVTILAGTGSSSMMNPDGGSQLKTFGAAQLTCP